MTKFGEDWIVPENCEITEAISHSSFEAKYWALASTTCELQWLTYLLKDLHITCSRPVVFYCDNQSAIHIAANSIFHELNKNSDIDCHIVREKAQQGLMQLLHVSFSNQIANIFTKALPPSLFTINLSKLELIDIIRKITATHNTTSVLIRPGPRPQFCYLTMF